MLSHKNILISTITVILLIAFISGNIYLSFTTSSIYNYQLSKYETSKIFHPEINNPLSLESLQLITLEIKHKGKLILKLGKNANPKFSTLVTFSRSVEIIDLKELRKLDKEIS